MDFSSFSKRATRASTRTTRSHCSSGPVADTSRWSTRNKMLRAFFLIFILVTIAWIAVFGFRGQKSGQPEIEIFPDMVRQPKVRAQSELNFFADQRGARQPVEGTVPIGYEMPMPGRSAESDPTGEMAMR